MEDELRKRRDALTQTINERRKELQSLDQEWELVYSERMQWRSVCVQTVADFGSTLKRIDKLKVSLTKILSS